jgi:hypothetical protein
MYFCIYLTIGLYVFLYFLDYRIIPIVKKIQKYIPTYSQVNTKVHNTYSQENTKIHNTYSQENTKVHNTYSQENTKIHTFVFS